MAKHKPNHITIKGERAYIELTNKAGEVVAQAIISASDVEKVRALNLRWFVTHGGNGGVLVAAMRSTPGNRGLILLHRFLMDAPKGMQVDHIDRDRLNNTRENLRLVTHQQNQQNRDVRRDSSTGVRNVQLVRGKYSVKLTVNGRCVWVGRFETLREAEAAAAEARLQHYPNTVEDRILPAGFDAAQARNFYQEVR